MPFDETTWSTPARQGDVAGIALDVAAALYEVVSCLNDMSAGKKPSQENIEKVMEMAQKLERSFDRLSGWTPGDTNVQP